RCLRPSERFKLQGNPAVVKDLFVRLPHCGTRQNHSEHGSRLEPACFHNFVSSYEISRCWRLGYVSLWCGWLARAFALQWPAVNCCDPNEVLVPNPGSLRIG